MRISVIIPAWQESPLIAQAVARAFDVGDEVIVADGGSPDGTAQAAARAGALLAPSAKGRGQQLSAGARAATGDVLVFLHADTRLTPNAREALQEALADPTIAGGNFFVRFLPSSNAARFMTWFCQQLRRRLNIYYGDSAIFVRRDTYHQLGGFRQVPLFEDFEFTRRLERHGRTVYVDVAEAHTSSRRFSHRPWRTMALWVFLQSLFWLGVSPALLARWYADIRAA